MILVQKSSKNITQAILIEDCLQNTFDIRFFKRNSKFFYINGFVTEFLPEGLNENCIQSLYEQHFLHTNLQIVLSILNIYCVLTTVKKTTKKEKNEHRLQKSG